MKICFILFYMSFCFFPVQCCITFTANRTNGTSRNYCQLVEDSRALYKQCFRCLFVEENYAMRLDQACAATLNLSCVELDVNDTAAMTNFPDSSLKILNDLFDRNNRTNQSMVKMLFVRVSQDTLEELHYENYRTFDLFRNRSYTGLSLELKNRIDRTTLKINPNNINITLAVLHINIYCNEKGLYQYGYWIEDNPKLKTELRCEIRPPDPGTGSNENNVTEQNLFIAKIKSNIVAISVGFSISILIPFLVITYFAYLVYRRRAAMLKARENEQTKSLESNETESVGSAESDESRVEDEKGIK